LTLGLSKVMAHWTEGTTNSSDPLLLLGAAVVLTLVAVLACMVPARRAAGIDPVLAIRYE